MNTTTLSLVLVLLGLGQAQTAPPREACTATPVAGGSATIAGIVIADTAERHPIRRVRVSVTSSDRLVDRTAITDDAGTFAIKALPPGRYTLTATKPGYVTLGFGATRPGRAGTPIAIDDGQQITGISLKLQRSGVITGTMLDQNGSPAVGINVSVMRFGFINGERRLVPGRGTSNTTDDRGAYRIFNIDPGDYVVYATPSSFGPATREDMRVLSAADVQSALDLLRAGTRGAPVGGPGGAPAAVVTSGYAPVFYPGATTQAQAALVTVASGEERTGVDFALQLVTTARVEGTLLLPDGTPATSGTLNLVSIGQSAVASPLFEGIRTARPDREGRFSFQGVTPGQYTILSRGALPGAAPPPPGPGQSRTPPLWASSDFAVEGQNISGVTLTLQQGMTVSGSVVLQGSTLPPPALTRMTVSLFASPAPGEANLGVTGAPIDANGQFTITGVTPGRYRLSTNVPGGRPDAPGWVMKSAIMDGMETLDAFYPLKRSVDGAVLTLTDTPTELSGAVQDSAGRAAPEYQIVVFASDKQFWTPQSRRIQTVRPTVAGKYVVRNLPPGEYLLAAVPDLEPGEQFDPSFLQQLSSAAFKITLSEGEKKAQDIRVGR